MIGKGSNVKMTTENDTSGTVLDIKDGFAEVAYKDKRQWFPISQLIDSSDELFARLTSEDFDDDLRFKLAMDAYRLRNAQSWEPYVLAASNRIDIFPHQVDELTWVLDRERVLVADEVGLGKTIIAAMAAAEFRARGVVKKALYIVPKSLVLKWKDELEEKFEIKSTELASTAEKITEETFKKKEYSYIASIDYLKQEHIIKHLDDVHIDMIIIDEAHKLKPGSDRFDLGKLLSFASTKILFLTATPHDGKDENFVERMQLLDPWASDVGSSNHLWVRNMKEDVVDINGKEVFPKRTSRTHKIGISTDEERVYDHLNAYLTSLMETAQSGSEANAVRFLRGIFIKRCSSSMKSLQISLERRLEKLGTVSFEDFNKYRKNMAEGDEQYDEEKFDEGLENIEAITFTQNIEQEKEQLKELIKIVESVSDKDSKLVRLKENISDLKSNDASAKLIVFTEYKDTMSAIIDELKEKYAVGKVYGGMKIDERKEEIAKFRSGEIEILICTDAAGEGLDMQFCNIEINYDLPWNPNKIEQRMGRIHRIGQTRDVSYHNYVIDNPRSTDGYIHEKLLEKIEKIKEALDDKVYDMFGSLLSEKDFEELQEMLAKTPYAQWEPKIRLHLEKIEENKRKIIERNETLLTSHRFNKTKLDSIQKIKKHAVDSHDVKRFFTVYCNKFRCDMNEDPERKDVWKVFLSKEIAQDTGENILIGTFDKEIANRTSHTYIALGNKFVNSMLKNAAKKSVAILSHHTRSGMMFVYRFTAINQKGTVQEEKVVFLFHNEDGTFDEVNGGSLWEYGPLDGIKADTGKLSRVYESVNIHIDEKLEAFGNKVRDKINHIQKNTEKMAKTSYARQAEEMKSEIQAYKKRLAEGPHIQSLITKQEKSMASLEKDFEEKQRNIKAESDISNTKELVGVAIVIPEEDATMRNRVGAQGEKLVYEYERNRARTDEERKQVKDVSKLDSGYDIESFGGRCIEVKSFLDTGTPTLTSHEWGTASRIGDDYYLYVLENVFGKVKMSIFKNPHKKFASEIIKKEISEYRYEISDWKGKADEEVELSSI